ncbi:MAG TPA: hypothetical protein VN700_17675 [Vicinamibacterales bacterium]|nr:hypothetical protein [Vicinamibacterales bacterium]
MLLMAAVLTPAALTREQGRRPVLLGRIAAAAAQRTPVGRSIATLVPSHGRLYVGYGDYTADTGPITIVSIDLATDTIHDSGFSFASEAIFSYRQIGDELFAPDIDPRRASRGGYARGIAGPGSVAWTDEKVVPATHVFDVASYDGRDLWLFGSLGSNAVAWRSTDDGRTWISALTVPPRAAGNFARMYSGVSLAGKLHTQVVDFPGGVRPTSLVYDGVGWSNGPRWFPPEVTIPDAFPWRPLAVGRQVMYLDQHTGATHRLVGLYRFDGVRAERAFGPPDAAGDPQFAVVDVTTSAGTAYLLNRRQEIWSSTDLGRWRIRRTFNAPGGETPTAIAVVGEDVYIGTNQSGIYKWSLR